MQSLMQSQEAIYAYYVIAPDERTSWLVLSACIEAEHLKQTFHLRIAQAEAMNRKPLRLAAAASDLQMYLDKIGEPVDLLPDEMIIGAAAIASAKKGIHEMMPWLMQCRANARASAARLGATRKSKMRGAAENAAIGYLASAIKEACGRPHYRRATILAKRAGSGNLHRTISGVSV